MKVLFTINSDVDNEWQRWRNNEELDFPTHILWGATHLSRYGIYVDILPYEKYVGLKKLGYSLKLGDLDQQVRVLQQHSQYDLVYSSGQTGSILLSVLRGLGLFKTPIAVKLERPFRDNLWNRILIGILVRGHDKVFCLSKRLYNQLKDDFNISESKLELLEWGADLEAYEIERQDSGESPTEKVNGSFVMSAGNTQRDFNTLVTAFEGIDYSLRIYCSGNVAPSVNIPPNVCVQYKHPTEGRTLTFKEILLEYQKAFLVAIPLVIPVGMEDYTNSFGLTSLLEAMAMGKAVVMTRNKQIDIDIEKERIGLWVAPGNVQEWQQAVTYLLEHPEETQAMGERSLHLCKQKYNLENYSAKLATFLKDAQK